MYKIDELEKMSKDQLIMLVGQLQIKIESQKKPSKAGVFNIGSPKYVRDYVDSQKLKLNKERGGSID